MLAIAGFRLDSKAIMMPKAVQTPGTESPMLSPTICGALPGGPVISIQPPIPWTQGLLAGQLE